MVDSATVHVGDCVEVMGTLPSDSVDAIITDPPYPCISRKYGKWTEAEWRELMDGVVAESRRVLKPSGSMMAVLQFNSERIGRMRPWLYRWMADMAEGDGDWGIVQDVWWWNTTNLPSAGCGRKHRLMRPSVKACVWIGPHDCYRNQDEVLWEPSDAMRAVKSEDRALRRMPSGHSVNRGRFADTLKERGGVTPFNIIPISGTSDAHSAGTPKRLCEWWVKYICPPGGVVLDPFFGHGTVGVAAIENGRGIVGIERLEEYATVAKERIASADPVLEGAT